MKKMTFNDYCKESIEPVKYTMIIGDTKIPIYIIPALLNDAGEIGKVYFNDPDGDNFIEINDSNFTKPYSRKNQEIESKKEKASQEQDDALYSRLDQQGIDNENEFTKEATKKIISDLRTIKIV